jgi:hypothetical protein
MLGTFGHTGDLASGASYTQSQSVTLPANEQGKYYIFVLAYSGQAVVEPTTRADATSAPSPIAISSPYAALAVSGVTAPASVSSGGTIQVSWTVTNNGDGTTDVASWQDRLYLSQSATPQPGDPILGTLTHIGVLAVGASYTGTMTVAVPSNLFGNYHVLVVSDVDGQVYQAGHTSADTAASGQIGLLSPDLQVSVTSAPAAAQPGQSETVSWTVTDAGTGNASGTWTDRLYYSPDGRWRTRSPS